MISMGTIEKLREQNHILALYCITCDRWGKADLDWLIQIGHGDKSVTEARLLMLLAVSCRSYCRNR